ncbi:DUF2752 domain-containing protein [Croceitalea rosinachiae]|uniref:DUF2752 domain-containing protein n=1 Tax=Croceitalea rosinachiae TaxID=3075596 RepID=A0ABU3ADI6_9FLAO|nr:DUF2752 domain-containing protein [Croceitalea sp. F388]MDT0606961.1 DUF2752 domain-containing protein [Croceitalea sp. F388]
MNATENIAYMGLQDYMLPCASKQILGFDCPGCGLQRSVLLLFQGEFLAAFEMYPAIYTLIPLILLIVVNKLFSLKIGGNILLIALSISSVFLILANFIFKLLH